GTGVDSGGRDIGKYSEAVARTEIEAKGRLGIEREHEPMPRGHGGSRRRDANSPSLWYSALCTRVLETAGQVQPPAVGRLKNL
ncbi:hypothetical protein KQX54_009323, partial [Cotesia glomerata]